MWGTKRTRVGLVWEKTGTILMVLKILCPEDTWVTALTWTECGWWSSCLTLPLLVTPKALAPLSFVFSFLEIIGVVICSCLNGICFDSYPSFKKEKFIVLFQWNQCWKYVTRKFNKFILTYNLSYFSIKKILFPEVDEITVWGCFLETYSLDQVEQDLEGRERESKHKINQQRERRLDSQNGILSLWILEVDRSQLWPEKFMIVSD